jgi:hypothetical protein
MAPPYAFLSHFMWQIWLALCKFTTAKSDRYCTTHFYMSISTVVIFDVPCRFLQNLELTIQQIRKQGMTYILDRDTHFEWSSYSGKPVQYSFFYIWRIGFILMYATRWMEEIDQCLSFDFLSQKIRFHCQNQLSCSFQNGIIGIRWSSSYISSHVYCIKYKLDQILFVNHNWYCIMW